MSYSIRTSGNWTCPWSSHGRSCSLRPILDLQRIAVRPAIAVVTIAIPLLQELLILALQVVLEDDAVDVRALVTQAFGFLEIGAVELRVVLQFAWLLDAVVERLPLARVRVHAAGFEQVAPFLGQRDDSVVAVEADGLHQP